LCCAVVVVEAAACDELETAAVADVCGAVGVGRYGVRFRESGAEEGGGDFWDVLIVFSSMGVSFFGVSFLASREMAWENGFTLTGNEEGGAKLNHFR